MARKNQQAEPKETHPELEKTEKFEYLKMKKF